MELLEIAHPWLRLFRQIVYQISSEEDDIWIQVVDSFQRSIYLFEAVVEKTSQMGITDLNNSQTVERLRQVGE